MEILVLGGTAFLGHEYARQAAERGHTVTCLARGESGQAAPGVTFVRADRRDPTAYDEVSKKSWDAVVEVSWQPGFVRDALATLASQSRHWAYVSSVNAYAAFDTPGADETFPLRAPTALDEVDRELYGEAKVACEQDSAAVAGDRLLIVRPGLIGGPGDSSDRAGAWVARAARAPEEPLLVPDTPGLATQVIDVRDQVAWMLTCAENGTTGTYDLVGPIVAFGEWIELCREIGGHTGPVVKVPAEWLVQKGVEQYMGPESLAMWTVEPGYEGWSTRTGAAALSKGLQHRDRAAFVGDVLAYEKSLGLDRQPRKAGLSPERERELLADFRAASE